MKRNLKTITINGDHSRVRIEQKISSTESNLQKEADLNDTQQQVYSTVHHIVVVTQDKETLNALNSFCA